MSRLFCPRQRTHTRSSWSVLAVSLVTLAFAACSQSTPANDVAQPAPDTRPAPPDTAEPAATPDVTPPRSEPPPRPPLPAGIARFEKDAITLTLSGTGQYLAGGDLAGKSLLWDLTTGRFLWGDPTPVGNRIGRVVFAETGDIWVGGSFDEPDRPWRAWSATNLERRGEFGTPGEVAIDLALDRLGQTAVVLTSAPDGSRQVVSVWKLDAQTPHFTSAALMSGRGAVAIAPDGLDVAVSDDRGGLVRFDLRTEGLVDRRIELVPPSSDAVAARVARLAYLTVGDPNNVGLWAAIKATIRRFPLDGDPKVQAPAVELADPTYPIRGLHRVQRQGQPQETLIVATRPEPGGLTFWNLEGKAIGELVTDCRCETHALSFDGSMAVCGCSPAADIRYGKPTWR